MSRSANWNLRIGLGLLAGLCLMALMPPPQDPVAQVDPAVSRYRPPGSVLHEVRLQAGRVLLAESVQLRGGELQVRREGETLRFPAAEVANLRKDGTVDRRFYLLGSDRFGRDVWSRIMVGARVSMIIAVLSMLLAASFGTVVGAVAATGGPWLDGLLMRGVDGLLAYPTLFLVLALSAILEPSTGQVVLLLGCTSWMGTCRLARAEVLSLRQRDFVLASRAIGQRPILIVLRHLLPNALTPLVVDSALMIGGLILSEAALSFFGLGVQPPTPSWGNMIGDGRDNLGAVWWNALFPGIAIAATVIGFNLLGDGLRDRLDPHHRHRTGTAEPC